MKNTTKAIMEIGQLIRDNGSWIDHRTYQHICDELAGLVESSDGDISDKDYVGWWNANLSEHQDD